MNRWRCRPPLPDDQVRKIAASVSRYGPEPDYLQAAWKEVEDESFPTNSQIHRARAKTNFRPAHGFFGTTLQSSLAASLAVTNFGPTEICDLPPRARSAWRGPNQDLQSGRSLSCGCRRISMARRKISTGETFHPWPRCGGWRECIALRRCVNVGLCSRVFSTMWGCGRGE